MRGTQPGIFFSTQAVGIIPAHAGNTCSEGAARPDRRDHPRTCGEHDIVVVGLLAQWGSSPHMRGTRSFPYNIGEMQWDHPRTCGEHTFEPYRVPVKMGSSPHMRGTPRPPPRRTARPGIIPAHAGNTLVKYLLSEMPKDHPRTCGEHTPVRSNDPSVSGSSPHMRGTHFEISTIPRFLDSFCLFFIQFYFEYFFARRYLLALLHPRRRAPPKDTSFVLDGRLTSSNPSQSVGDQSAPCTLNARCCSFLAE